MTNESKRDADDELTSERCNEPFALVFDRWLSDDEVETVKAALASYLGTA